MDVKVKEEKDDEMQTADDQEGGDVVTQGNIAFTIERKHIKIVVELIFKWLCSLLIQHVVFVFLLALIEQKFPILSAIGRKYLL